MKQTIKLCFFIIFLIVLLPGGSTYAQDSTLADIGYWKVYTSFVEHTPQDKLAVVKIMKQASSDYLFYFLIIMLTLLGVVRSVFPKYFNDLFILFFRVTFKQKAIRERLLESKLPSVMLNILFFFSASFFLFYVSNDSKEMVKNNFWYGMGFWLIALISIYSFKLLFLKGIGWLFQMQEIGNIYSFIIFMVNKVAGVFLVPIIIFLALGPVMMRPALITIAIITLIALFIYRYIISYPSLRTTVSINQFHFFLYLCAFEIIPLLLIYKVVVVYF